ncbi:MAG TPA: T9SS type A sorting domain-containing protein [Panacibacter sp.]|nr:T9SS type A sorting domain-containing protein [Panacibacter sp.]HNP46154.1 T9SS type A sorting domain-containing protein [Panacibacter sp.]
MKKNYLLAGLAALLCTTLHAQNISIIKDVNDAKDSYPSNSAFSINNRERTFPTLNNVTYFTSSDGVHGYELWRTDGTKNGTFMLKDINPNTGAGSFPSSLTLAGNIIFFVADDGQHGMELWKTDGTAEGTVMVSDILPGTVGSFPNYLTAVNNLVFFIGFDDVNGYEIWRSDGTEAGTFLTKDLSPGLNYQNPIYLTKIGNKLWFVLNSTYSAADGIYASDGTSEGTTQVFSSLGCGQMLGIGKKVFFVNYDYNYGSELWVTDGVTSNIVKDILPGTDGSLPGELVNMNGILYFSAGANPYYIGNGDRELYRSDGTYDGTYKVADIYAGPYNSSAPTYLTVVRNQVFFTATNELGFGLWKSDGTAEGTFLVKPFNNTSVTKLTAANNLLYFSAEDANGQELWVSDGTNSNTKLVKDIFPGLGGSNPSYLTPNKNKVIFAATGTSGAELWKSDGTEAGTELVKDINRSTTSSSYPYGFAALNNNALFYANTNAYGQELWKTDGTNAGTVMVKDIYPGSQTSNQNSALVLMAPAGNGLVLSAASPVFGNELWKTDGTSAGTQMLKDLTPGSAGSNFVIDQADVSQFHSSGNKCYFVLSNNPSYGDVNLWVTDGTEGGTHLINYFLNDSYLRDLTAVNNKLMFTGFSYYVPSQLMVTDGTAAGTITLNGIDPKAASFRSYKDSLVYFNSNDNNFWVSDGTNEGTHMLKSNFAVYAIDFDFFPQHSASLNGNLAFGADDFLAGTELWITNGTTAGTKLVKDINPGATGSYPNNFTLVNSTVFFTANDGSHGKELWKSDGTKKGTVLVKDISTGSASSQLGNLTNANGILYFTVTDALYNIVMWQSDGTEAGTHPVADNNFPALSIGSFWPWLVINNKMFLQASTAELGSEPTQALLNTAAAASLQFAGNMAGTDALLNWQAVNEKEVAGYTLQRSENGIDFTTIGKLSARKLQAYNNYSYTDRNIGESTASTVYYRLQQLAGDDAIISTKTVAVNLKNMITVNVLPNPVINNFQLNLQLKAAQKLLVKVNDAGGNTLLAETRNMQGGSSVLNYKASAWPAGSYILTVTLEDGTKKEVKIVKQ